MKTTIVTKLKREATKILAQLAEDHEPVLVTEHGKPAAYLVDVQTYELQQDRLKIMEGIALGEKAIQEGRTYTQDQAKKRLNKWLE
ncbi:MAG: type II toxin-antitoxin system Phd/YefM family antitoxin [Lentisphaeria bacterium]|nr:type II toxin-antitoxin system Phd/YefM family antitoxin [Lentisphaeria bacterium]NQZ68997.1 type II toxin-antitoxin system Phd/YefM family antitoxin [Lentisphaeria bacterium]